MEPICIPLGGNKRWSQEVNANSLSPIFVRQIGHSEQAREQDLHTAEEMGSTVISQKRLVEIWNFKWQNLQLLTTKMPAG